ncbi:uncharacterized protein LOC143629365 [Bidens hawaiensis]|uniref:uncharacterized protein LOC143629365 n=1 Tax=Bidens hawaiensis TaxID=980011 RepID=UPI00404B5520
MTDSVKLKHIKLVHHPKKIPGSTSDQTYQPKPQYHNQEPSTSQQTTNETTTNSLLTQLLAITETANKLAEQRNRLTEERFQKNEIELRNQRAHLQNIETQVGQLALLFSERQPGGLPSNTVNNPNAAVNAVTLRSGRTTMVTEPTSEPVVTEKETEIPEEVQERLVPASTARPKEQVRTYIPPIPYPTRLKKERLEAQYGKFLELFKQLHINIPFVEALSQMPKYAKFLKDVLSKRKLEELSHVMLNKECSAILQNKLPEKMTDPGSFTIPCLIGRIGEPKPTRMSIQLADRSIKYPRGIVENMLVKIDKFVFPVDFVILDMDEDKNVPLILGRPFLATARALIDVCTGKLTLRVNDKQVTFDIGRSMQHPQHHDDSLYCIDVIDSVVSFHVRNSSISNALDTQILKKPISEPIREDHIVEEVIKLEDQEMSSPQEVFEVVDIKLENKAKPSTEEPPILELKELPDHLEYDFLEGESQLPVIISANLSIDEKKKLLDVLKLHKKAIAWKIIDSKGISPSFCTHKILMEEDYKPVFQYQRRLNPNIPVQVVPKKGGMTVIMNEKDELIPMRTVTGWRVCIDYRKLNDSTRKDHFPLPFIDQMLERLSGKMFYCFLDGFSGYFQIPIAPEDQENTTFTCPYAFNFLKDKLINAPIMVAPDWTLPFEIMCDANDFAVGAVLGQRKDKHFHPIYYASKTLNDAQENYTITEYELLAVVFAFNKFRSYLVLSKTIVYTDHAAIRYLFKKQDAKPRLIRWVLLLQEIDIEIQDKRGAEKCRRRSSFAFGVLSFTRTTGVSHK